MRATIPLYKSDPLIPNFIDLTHVKNPGVSFSFLGTLPSIWRVPLLAGISLGAAILLLWYWLRPRVSQPSPTRLCASSPGAAGAVAIRPRP